MRSAAQIRNQIETALAERIPAALTPSPRMSRAITATGIQSVDALLEGGLPVGAITESVGPECSGRTSLALSFVAGMTQDNEGMRLDRCVGRDLTRVGSCKWSGLSAALGALRNLRMHPASAGVIAGVRSA